MYLTYSPTHTIRLHIASTYIIYYKTFWHQKTFDVNNNINNRIVLLSSSGTAWTRRNYGRRQIRSMPLSDSLKKLNKSLRSLPMTDPRDAEARRMLNIRYRITHGNQTISFTRPTPSCSIQISTVWSTVVRRPL